MALMKIRTINYDLVMIAICDLEQAFGKTHQLREEKAIRFLRTELEKAVESGEVRTQLEEMHGAWELVGDDDWSQPERYRCTACDHRWRLQSKQHLIHVRKTWLYCPHCGATMH